MKKIARSASRRGKTPTGFQFDLTIDRVTGLKLGGSYFIKWTRGVKVASTRLRTCKSQGGGHPGGRPGITFGEKLSLLVTLFRESSGSFDVKDSKLSLVAVGKSKSDGKTAEKTVAKVHFNLADFAGVPSATTNKTFKLSEKVIVKTTIESRFVKAPKGGAAYASSTISGISGVSGRSSLDNEDDFADLDITDVPEPASAPASSPQRLKKNPSAPSHPRPTKSSANPAVISPSTKRELRKAESGPNRATSSSDRDAKTLETEVARLERELQLDREKLQKAEQAVYSMGLQLKEAQGKVQTMAEEKENGRTHAEKLRAEAERTKSLQEEVSALKLRNRGLENRIDTLMVTAAKAESGDQGNVEQVLADMRKDKSRLEAQLKAHQNHATKVKETYTELSVMYDKLREDNFDLQKELKDVKAQLSSERMLEGDVSAKADGDSDLRARNTTLEQELLTAQRDREHSAKEVESLKEINARMKTIIEGLQKKQASITEQYEASNLRVQNLQEQLEDLKDSAPELTHSTGSAASGIVNISDPTMLRNQRDRAMREIDRVKAELADARDQIDEANQSLEQEKREAEKLRKDLEYLRQENQALSRTDSEVTRTQGKLSTLQRQLSSQRRDKMNADQLIEQLKGQVQQLEHDHANGISRNGENADDKYRRETQEIVESLVTTKLRLAQAEDEKLQLQFSMKQLKISERRIQERLGEKASRLEVRLREANAELERYRGMEKRGELNDFGKNVSDDDFDVAQ